MLPEVAILIPTYNRKRVLEENLTRLSHNLKYNGPLKVVIGDDSDNDGLTISPTYEAPGLRIEYYRHQPRKGLGANLNWLLENCGTDYVIQMDDDHILLKELDITPHVHALMEDATAGVIRLMHVAGHKYRANLDGSYWRIDWESPEVYIASNRPHLKHVTRFHSAYGFYTEGLKLGLTEETFCHTCIDKHRQRSLMGMVSPDVLIPLDVQTESSWDHIGHSWQMEGF